MIIKKILLIIIFILINNKVYSDNIFIVTSINDEILTNIDINQEVSYLKILNPKLKTDQLVEQIGKVNFILGKTNVPPSQQKNLSSNVTNNNVMGGGGTANINSGNNTTNNNN